MRPLPIHRPSGDLFLFDLSLRSNCNLHCNDGHLSCNYWAFRENSLLNNLVIFLVCFTRCFDTAEDVYHGLFQQAGPARCCRKSDVFRVLTSTLAFLAALYLTKDLVVTTTIAIAVAAVGFFSLMFWYPGSL